jgi:hypothetical protein
MESSTNFVILAALVIGPVYGAVGLVSGFCMMSSLRVRRRVMAAWSAPMHWQWARGLRRHSYSRRAAWLDLGKSIYLQPAFSAPMMFLGGLLFGYGMVLSNGCGSRALVLLGRGNLRSFVVVIVLRHFCRDHAEGPDRADADRNGAGVADNGEAVIAARAVVDHGPRRSFRAHGGGVRSWARPHHLCVCAHAFRKSPGQIAAGPVSVFSWQADGTPPAISAPTISSRRR